jgi:tetratricopeptide (TPR) repeat protein
MPAPLETARDLAEKAREAAAQNPDAFPAFIEALLHLGNLQRESDAQAAEATYRQALHAAEGKELAVGALASLRMQLATLLDFTDRENDAAPFYEDAITDYEALATVSSKETAAQLRNNLAMSYKGLGKYALAEQHYLRALETLEASHGRNSEAVATLFNNLGGLYYVAGFPDQAREMFQDALQVRSAVLGGNHRDTAQAHSNLATACHELRDNNAAQKHFEEALRILESHGTDELRSFEATSLDYIAMLEVISETEKMRDISAKLEKALSKA